MVLVPTVFRRLAQVSTLIEAIHEMKGEEDVHLLLTGALKSDRQSADTRADLERQIRSLGVRSQVHFTGYLEHIEDAYAAADVVAIPTRYEAFGLPALEAMAVGLPALGSSTGAFAELVEDGSSGTCLDVRDARAWVDALHAVLGDPEAAARMGEAGRQRAVENFSIVDHWDRLFEIYASGRRHPGPKIAIG